MPLVYLRGYNVCSVMKLLYPGDLVHVRQKSNSADLGIYHVRDSVVGNKLYLYETNAFGNNGTINQEVVVEVLRSGRTNQLNTSVGGFTTYGDTARVLSNWDPNELADRLKFVDTLNRYLHTLHFGSVPSASIPAGLYYLNSAGSCLKMKDNISSISFATGAGPDFSMTVYTDPGIQGCQETFSDTDGVFGLDEITKDLMFYSPGNNCYGVPVVCIKFCPDQIKTTQVVVADAKTFGDNWTYDNNIYPIVAGSNKYENGQKGKWRQLSSYIYKDTIIGANFTNQRNYKNAGVFKLQLFNWHTPGSIDTNKWIKLSTVTQYAPDGNAIEEKDILGIYSAAKFGYDNTQPFLVAKNSEYQSVQFDGFEKEYASPQRLEDGWAPAGISTNRVNTHFHSGQYSWRLGDGDTLVCKNMKATSSVRASGLLLKVWVKDDNGSLSLPIAGKLSGGGTINFSFSKVARVGAWTLWQAQISGASITSAFALNSTITPKIYNKYQVDMDLWLDDIRIQPLDAQMITYVYDIATLRLITTFDDQHFGMYYQYNAEGKLVRKLVETEKGMKTITETQYHVPQQNR